MKHHICIAYATYSLCGREAICRGGSTFTSSVKFIDKRDKPDWCKICKKMYNADYSSQFLFHLK